jgi:hypothetical protein
MRTMILAAFAALSLGTGAAFAHGGPGGGGAPGLSGATNYGSTAFADHSNDPEVHFLGKGTVFGRMFGHSDSDHGVADRTAATSAKGG